jgi:hypothetical protein
MLFCHARFLRKTEVVADGQIHSNPQHAGREPGGRLEARLEA